MIISILSLAAVTVSGGGILNVLIQLLVIGLIFWLIWWAVGTLGVPQPFAKVIQVILVVAAVIFCINALLSLTGGGFVRFG